MKPLVLTLTALAAPAVGTATALSDAGPASEARAMAAFPAAHSSAAVRITDIDADLLNGRRLRLKADTRGASRVTFRYRGHNYRGRVVESDGDEREWARTVRTRGGDANGGRRVRIGVRACRNGTCAVKTSREHLERPGSDDDGGGDD